MIHKSPSGLKRAITSFHTPSQSQDSSPGEPRKKFWGMLQRKERWGLSWRGRLIVTASILMVFWLVFLEIYPFLAVTHRVDTNILVVEGWVHQYAARAAAEEFKSGNYQRIFTTGGPVNGSGGYINDYNTSASVGAGLLRKAGVADESVQMVPSRVMSRDRTYSSAIALRDWFREHNMSVHGINVVTEDVHARRTWLLFQEALGPGVEVGIISVPNPDYDASHWWRFSEGVREVMSEGIACIYAKFFFWPAS